MPPKASTIFNHLAQHPTLDIARHEVECSAFNQLRRSVYRLVIGLQDADMDEIETAHRLRQSLSEWLTVPIQLAHLQTSVLDELGSSAAVGVRWGAEVRTCFDAAVSSAHAVKLLQSPLRRELANALKEADASGLTLRIHCHRGATEHFASCAAGAGVTLGADAFVHSLRDYRDADPFDVLIKVGPLRTRGCGYFPAACLNAARYRCLKQLVWAGMSDEEGFGDDPLILPWQEALMPVTGVSSTANSTPPVLRWLRTIIVHPDTTVGANSAPDDAFTAPDELLAFSAIRRNQPLRRALLLHVGSGLAVFYAPHAEVLLLKNVASEPRTLSRRELSAGNLHGSILVRADVGDVNMGAHSSNPGWYSAQWKAELIRRFTYHPEGLIRELRAAGLTLRNLHARVEHWCQRAPNVISAPQQRRHFNMLIDVLDMERASATPAADRPRTVGSWSSIAWDEVRRSRGLAIQFGMQEQEIIGEEVEDFVLSMLTELELQLNSGEPFREAIPSGNSLDGSISFFPILSVETNFLVPDTLLGSLLGMSEVEEWRA
jgi:hypothetical protein